MQSFLSVRRAASAVFILVAVVLAGAFFVVSPDTASAQSSVSMVDNQFQPASVTVDVGATITWTNNGQNSHTATASGVFDTGTLAPASSGSVTLSEPGTYDYICSIHGAAMSGSIVVMGAPAETDDDAPAADASTTDTTTTPNTGTGSVAGKPAMDPLAIGAIGSILLIFGVAARKRTA